MLSDVTESKKQQSSSWAWGETKEESCEFCVWQRNFFPEAGLGFLVQRLFLGWMNPSTEVAVSVPQQGSPAPCDAQELCVQGTEEKQQARC